MTASDDVLERYARLVEASPHNLLSPRGLAELRSRHIPESVALAGMLPEGPARVVDIGSGGGLPGLVIALARPDLEVTLVEATQKKARFLEESAQALGVEVDVAAERAEDLSGRLGGRFDLATARAVAPLSRLVPWALPLLRPGGRLYAVKGERWEQELEEARGALRNHDAELVAVPDRGSGDPRAPLVVIIAAGTGRRGAEDA